MVGALQGMWQRRVGITCPACPNRTPSKVLVAAGVPEVFGAMSDTVEAAHVCYRGTLTKWRQKM